jgi:exodeoxyribonuclease V alpha subunit
VENVQILSPFRSDGDASSERPNAEIREIVNPPAPGKNEINVGVRTFRAGDKVMQTKNKNGVSNGELGFVREIRNGSAVIEFTGQRTVEYGCVCQ